MARLLDANTVYAGLEPKFTIELTQIQLMQALNWYSQNKDTKDAYKYASDYFKKNFKMDIGETIKEYPSTFGWLCRILSNGGSLSIRNQVYFDDKVEEIKRAVLEAKNKPKVVEPKSTTPVTTIQERMGEKIAEVVGELEASIDDYILSGFEKMPAPYGIMHDKTKGAYVPKIVEVFKKHRSEFDEVLTTEDEQLKEGYSNFTKPQMKKLVAYCDLIITDALKFAEVAKTNRKPRKKKQKSPDQLVSKMKCLDKFEELKLESVPAKDIIGALQLWVYNTKTRKLGCYIADDAGGLSVKGSSILNYTEHKSVNKKLRKPEATLPEILKGGKVYLRNALDGIKAVATPLTGRINSDTILLRIVK
jgi:hypothetical protein